MFKTLILLAGLWVTVYTVSYGIYEFKRKNKSAVAGICFLTTVILVALAKTLYF